MIVLPWPPRELSPNARVHWARKSKLTKAYRAQVAIAVRSARPAEPLPFVGERLPLRLTFNPPDRRARDDDNMIGAFKAGRDQLADELGVNDRCFAPHYVIGEPVKGGQIVVEIGA